MVRVRLKARTGESQSEKKQADAKKVAKSVQVCELPQGGVKVKRMGRKILLSGVFCSYLLLSGHLQNVSPYSGIGIYDR